MTLKIVKGKKLTVQVWKVTLWKVQCKYVNLYLVLLVSGGYPCTWAFSLKVCLVGTLVNFMFLLFYLEFAEGDEPVEEPIKYPIDDLLVQPDADDPVFTDRPSPSRDFNVPMECVGDLLMVWDFCSSFGRLLHLWPFSLEDFENAICHKKGNLVLLVETHSALLRLLIKDNGEYFSAVRKRNRKLKVNHSLAIYYLSVYVCPMNIYVNTNACLSFLFFHSPCIVWC